MRFPRATHRGYLPIQRNDVYEVLAHHADAEAHPAADGTSSRKLTRREREVFELVRLGMTNPQIAEKLSIARSTVKSHIERILDKLGLCGRVEIIVGLPQEIPRNLRYRGRRRPPLANPNGRSRHRPEC